MKTFAKRVILLATTCSFLSAQISWAGAPAENESGTDVLADAFLARPAGLVMTTVGSVAYAVILPFSLIVGGTKTVGKALVERPFNYTFRRPFGSDWREMDP